MEFEVINQSFVASEKSFIFESPLTLLPLEIYILITIIQCFCPLLPLVHYPPYQFTIISRTNIKLAINILRNFLLLILEEEIRS